MLTDAELDAIAALEALADDEADYVAVGKDKLLVLCRALRGSGLRGAQVAVAHSADKAERLERTVEEFARLNEALRQKSEAMQARYMSLRQELMTVKSWVDARDSIDEARHHGVREPDGSPLKNAWRNGFETCQEAVLERLDGIPLVALTDEPLDRFVDLNAVARRIEALERDLAHERDNHEWLLDRMNAIGLALGMRAKSASPDKLLRQALRLEGIALAAEQLLARLGESAGASSDAILRELGLASTVAEVAVLAGEIERWRNDPDTMRADPEGEGDEDPAHR